MANAVTYDTAKTEAILFSKAQGKKRKDQISTAWLTVGDHQVKFNDKATRWRGVWLDSGLTFSTHIKERVNKAQAVEARIKGLTRTYGFPQELVRKIQIAVVQAVAFFVAEL